MLFFALLVLCGLITQSLGHGRLMEPVGRSSAWRLGYNVPRNYDDNALFCGGFAVSFNMIVSLFRSNIKLF